PVLRGRARGRGARAALLPRHLHAGRRLRRADGTAWRTAREPAEGGCDPASRVAASVRARRAHRTVGVARRRGAGAVPRGGIVARDRPAAAWPPLRRPPAGRGLGRLRPGDPRERPHPPGPRPDGWW